VRCTRKDGVGGVRDRRCSSATIQQAIVTEDAHTEVFFVDVADIELNPRIGSTRSRRGRRHAVPTPGQDEKHYVAGALNARSGRLVWVEHRSKNTTLFLSLLEAIRRSYRRTSRIVLILDNYVVHKTDAVQPWRARRSKFTFPVQPVYYPRVNRIERLWKAMHGTVTRNHTWVTLYKLCQFIKHFFEVVQPFPGAGHGVAVFRVAISPGNSSSRLRPSSVV
jgi:transposase